MKTDATNPEVAALLVAATRLLEARQDQMVTTAEWRALAEAVAQADPSVTPDDLLTKADRPEER